MYRPYRHVALAVTALATATLAACSGDGGSNAGDDTPRADGSGGSAALTLSSVDAALADVPDAIFARFALADDTIGAAEAFRRTDYVGGSPDTVSWGVEGASEDESRELEIRYDAEGGEIERVVAALVDTLSNAVDAAVRARYPGATIEEIVRVESGDTVTWAVLVNDGGEEIELNVDEAGTVLEIEQTIAREALPAAVRAIVDREASDALPEASFERLLVDGELDRYEVEYENEAGQSLSIQMDESGTILFTEHEDALENLAPGDTVEAALEDYPTALEGVFAADYPEVAATEIFRRVEFGADGTGAAPLWGIEGVSADESLEIEAVYTAAGERVEESRESVVEALPAGVESAFAALYPAVVPEEIVRVESATGTSYAIGFEADGAEREVTLDASGALLAAERVIGETEVPEAVLARVGAERVGLPLLEFERVEAADGTIVYEAEYEYEPGEDADGADDEAEDGEAGVGDDIDATDEDGAEDDDDGEDEGGARSVSYKLDAEGTLLAVEHEAEL